MTPTQATHRRHWITRACYVEWVTTDSDLDDGDWSFRIGGINARSR